MLPPRPPSSSSNYGTRPTSPATSNSRTNSFHRQKFAPVTIKNYDVIGSPNPFVATTNENNNNNNFTHQDVKKLLFSPRNQNTAALRPLSSSSTMSSSTSNRTTVDDVDGHPPQVVVDQASSSILSKSASSNKLNHSVMSPSSPASRKVQFFYQQTEKFRQEQKEELSRRKLARIEDNKSFYEGGKTMEKARRNILEILQVARKYYPSSSSPSKDKTGSKNKSPSPTPVRTSPGLAHNDTQRQSNNDDNNNDDESYLKINDAMMNAIMMKNDTTEANRNNGSSTTLLAGSTSSLTENATNWIPSRRRQKQQQSEENNISASSLDHSGEGEPRVINNNNNSTIEAQHDEATTATPSRKPNLFVAFSEQDVRAVSRDVSEIENDESKDESAFGQFVSGDPFQKSQTSKLAGGGKSNLRVPSSDYAKMMNHKELLLAREGSFCRHHSAKSAVSETANDINDVKISPESAVNNNNNNNAYDGTRRRSSHGFALIGGRRRSSLFRAFQQDELNFGNASALDTLTKKITGRTSEILSAAIQQYCAKVDNVLTITMAGVPLGRRKKEIHRMDSFDALVLQLKKEEEEEAEKTKKREEEQKNQETEKCDHEEEMKRQMVEAAKAKNGSRFKKSAFFFDDGDRDETEEDEQYQDAEADEEFCGQERTHDDDDDEEEEQEHEEEAEDLTKISFEEEQLIYHRQVAGTRPWEIMSGTQLPNYNALHSFTEITFCEKDSVPRELVGFFI